ncbi:MAG: medium chain dehydrogenase/reductase family protein [Spongiibacter sp.]
MYRRIVLKKFGGPEQLELREEPVLPEPSVGQLRVKVLAAGVGFTDTIVRQGQYVGVKDKPPFTPGYDWYGVVDAVGDGVEGFAIGDTVADMPVIGSYTEYLCVAADRVVKTPPGLDPAEAVAMILSYTTAYQMLHREVSLTPGQSCLIHAAGGAVGTAVLELGRMMGLTLYGTGSPSKKAVIEGFGAHHIDYTRGDVQAQLMAATDGQGVDLVLDTLGAHSWTESYRCLKKGGTLLGFGAMHLTTGQASTASVIMGFAKLLALWKCLPDGRHTGFYNIQSRREKHPEEFKADVAELLGWLAQGKLKPVVSARCSMADISALHRRLDSGDVVGKAALLMG